MNAASLADLGRDVEAGRARRLRGLSIVRSPATSAEFMARLKDVGAKNALSREGESELDGSGSSARHRH